MTIEERIAGMESRLGKNDELVRELREAMTATALMEARQSRAIRQHTEWLEENTLAIQASRNAFDESLKASRKDFDERMKALDVRITNLVSGMGEFMRRGKAE
jgi:hypothetical protein